jgi:hypothetical protein
MTNVPPPPADVPPPSGSGVPPAGSFPPPAPGPSPYAAPAAGQSSPYGAPGQPPQYAAPSGGSGPKQGLSLTSFIIGVASLVLAVWLVPILGLLVGAAAVILGFIAKGKEPFAPKWMWLVGLITGFVTIGLNLIFTFLFIGALSLIGTAGQLPTSP